MDSRRSWSVVRFRKDLGKMDALKYVRRPNSAGPKPGG